MSAARAVLKAAFWGWVVAGGLTLLAWFPYVLGWIGADQFVAVLTLGVCAAVSSLLGAGVGVTGLGVVVLRDRRRR